MYNVQTFIFFFYIYFIFGIDGIKVVCIYRINFLFIFDLSLFYWRLIARFCFFLTAIYVTRLYFFLLFYRFFIYLISFLTILFYVSFPAIFACVAVLINCFWLISFTIKTSLFIIIIHLRWEYFNFRCFIIYIFRKLSNHLLSNLYLFR